MSMQNLPPEDILYKRQLQMSLEMDLYKLNQDNKKIETSIFSLIMFFSNTWMTLIAPLIIGLLASKLFADQGFSTAENAIYSIATVLHIVFAILIFKAANRNSVSIAVDECVEENTKLKEEVVPKAAKMYDTAIKQQITTYLMTLELESLIDEINLKPSDYPLNKKLQDWSEGVDRILQHLVMHRTQLFGYSGESLYNFALYKYDDKSDELYIDWRSCDNRLSTSNRRWKPGFGHVGLAYIQSEAKICHDICESPEVSDGANLDADKAKYRSFISVPIKDSGYVFGGKKPLGVLVFTSNVVNQFSWQRDKFFVLTVAKLLSIYIERNLIACAAGEPDEDS